MTTPQKAIKAYQTRSSAATSLRTIALSATLSNTNDVATWLDATAVRWSALPTKDAQPLSDSHFIPFCPVFLLP